MDVQSHPELRYHNHQLWTVYHSYQDCPIDFHMLHSVLFQDHESSPTIAWLPMHYVGGQHDLTVKMLYKDIDTILHAVRCPQNIQMWGALTFLRFHFLHRSPHRHLFLPRSHSSWKSHQPTHQDCMYRMFRACIIWSYRKNKKLFD